MPRGKAENPVDSDVKRHPKECDEKKAEKEIDQVHDTENDVAQGQPDCPVCLQPCIYPVQLPCRHIFCFLCVKGAASRSRRCALCRQDIPPDFLFSPHLLNPDDLAQTRKFDDGFQWFYEGQNGWWQYDDRTSIELERYYKNGETVFELLIAGFIYIIDLKAMVQYRRNDRTRKRRILRELATIPNKKGVAGLLFTASQENPDSDRLGGDGESGSSSSSGPQTIPIQQPDRSAGYSDSLSPPTPYNTPQTPQTPAESPPRPGTSEQELSAQLRRLGLEAGVLGGAAGGVSPPELFRLPDRASASHHSSAASLGQGDLAGIHGDTSGNQGDASDNPSDAESEIYQQIQRDMASDDATAATPEKSQGDQV